MNEAKALVLIDIVGPLIAAAAVLGFAALGVRGPILSLGMLIPLAIGAYAISRVVMHYGESGRGPR